MHQVGVLASGPHSWTAQVTAAHENLCAYASTLALYIYDVHTFRLLRILTGHTKVIVSFAFAHSDLKTRIASVGMDKSLRIWAVNSGEMLHKIDLPGVPSTVVWDTSLTDVVTVGMRDGSVWNYDLQKQLSYEITWALVSPSKLVSPVAAIAYSNSGSHVAIGRQDGCVYVVELDPSDRLRKKHKSQKIKPLTFPPSVESGRTGSVATTQWDPHSDVYLLVTWENGYMSIFDVSQGVHLAQYDRQTIGIRSACWLPHEPGSFVTADGKSSVLRRWNVSQRQMLGSVRLKSNSEAFSIQSLTFLKPHKSLLLSTMESHISVYHCVEDRLTHCSEPKHSETIFCCRFHPSFPDIMATGSYDGRVKVWEMPSMRCLQTVLCDCSLVYSLAWRPSGSQAKSLLVVGGFDGSVVFVSCSPIDTTQRILHREKLHDGPVYGLDWYPHTTSSGSGVSSHSEWVLSAGSDKSVLLYDYSTKTKLASFKFPDSVFGVHWSPTVFHRFAVGGFNGEVAVLRVIEDMQASSGFSIELEQTLKGHSDRVYNVQWHPYARNMLLSSSNDRTCRVWNLEDDTSVALSGHRDNVRAITWSPVLPWVCLSGGWDGEIRTWNAATGACLDTQKTHHSDVYAIAVHPQRPFFYVSTSRDTTVRLWFDSETSTRILKRMLWMPYVQTRELRTGNSFAVSPEMAMKHSAWRDSYAAMLEMSGPAAKSNQDAVNAAVPKERAFVRDFGGEVSSGDVSRFWDEKAHLDILDWKHTLPLLQQFVSPFCFKTLFSLLLHARGDSVTAYPELARGNWVGDTQERLHIYNFDGLSDDSSLTPLINELHDSESKRARSLLSPSQSLRAISRSCLGDERLDFSPAHGVVNGEVKMLAESRKKALDAVSIYMRQGEIGQAVDALFSLGEYDEVLALSPMVSLPLYVQYAQTIGQKYLQAADSRIQEKGIRLLMCIGKSDAVMAFYVQNNRHREALTLLQTLKSGRLRSTVPAVEPIPHANEAPKREMWQAQEHAVVSELSNRSSQNGYPVLSAAYRLYSHQWEECIRALLTGNEVLLAYCVLRAAKKVAKISEELHDTVCQRLARKTARSGDHHIALQICGSIISNQLRRDMSMLIGVQYRQWLVETGEGKTMHMSDADLPKLEAQFWKLAKIDTADCAVESWEGLDRHGGHGIAIVEFVPIVLNALVADPSCQGAADLFVRFSSHFFGSLSPMDHKLALREAADKHTAVEAFMAERTHIRSEMLPKDVQRLLECAAAIDSIRLDNDGNGILSTTTKCYICAWSGFLAILKGAPQFAAMMFERAASIVSSSSPGQCATVFTSHRLMLLKAQASICYANMAEEIDKQQTSCMGETSTMIHNVRSKALSELEELSSVDDEDVAVAMVARHLQDYSFVFSTVKMLEQYGLCIPNAAENTEFCIDRESLLPKEMAYVVPGSHLPSHSSDGAPSISMVSQRQIHGPMFTAPPSSVCIPSTATPRDDSAHEGLWNVQVNRAGAISTSYRLSMNEALSLRDVCPVLVHNIRSIAFAP